MGQIKDFPVEKHLYDLKAISDVKKHIQRMFSRLKQM